MLLADTEHIPSTALERLCDCYLTDRSIKPGSRCCWQDCKCSAWSAVNDLEVGALVQAVVLSTPSQVNVCQTAQT
jgi:hypothetical protein